MKQVATASEIRNIDQFAIRKCGIPEVVLMENAGIKIFNLLSNWFPNLSKKQAIIIAGKGNNGGDGFVIARHLFNHKIPVKVYVLEKITALKNGAKINADASIKTGVHVIELNANNIKTCHHDLKHSAVIVDAILGSGFKIPVNDFYRNVFETINRCQTPVVSVDIPSGIDSDTGQLKGPHVIANYTVSLALLKRSHLLFPAAEHVGELHVVDISIPQKAVAQQNPSIYLVEENDIQSLLKKRPRNSHKGSFGHVLVVAGSRGKGGAAGLTALAALRAGAGLVTLAVPESCHQALEYNPLEVMTIPLPENSKGCLTSAAKTIFLNQMEGKNALALGPGLSTNPDTKSFIESILPQIHCPTVLDADGLNCLSMSPALMKKLPSQLILTPHLKEMSRLLKKSMDNIIENRIISAQSFASQKNVFLVLKGANTLIALPDQSVFINPTGNPGMATAGTGDVLTGLIAGLLAQKFDLKSSCLVGCYLHGLAGDLIVDKTSQTSLIASELINFIPLALKHICP